MTDINIQLRESYVSLLGSITVGSINVPIFYAQEPTGQNYNYYILINNISSAGFNTECNNMVNATVQLMIVTKAENNNSGQECSSIAGQILEIIIPSPRAKAVTITDGQVIGTDLAQDREITGLTDGMKKLVNRVINFQHVISVN